MEQDVTATLYRGVLRIRRAEERIAEIYPTDKIQSPVHLSIGQEAISVGVCAALNPEDAVFGTYRSHACYLAKGGDMPRLFAELYGKATGCAKGKGGSMHIVDVAAGVMGTSAVVATGIPHAVGYAYAVKRSGRPVVVVCFFGDGAVDEGVFSESLSFAALQKLPVLFVCENNGYAIHSPQHVRQACSNIAERARVLGVHAEEVLADNDVFEILRRAKCAVEIMRCGAGGPFFLECRTYRWREHVGPNEDFDCGYRARSEALSWIENDELLRLERMLPPETVAAIRAAVEAEVAAAIAFAEASPFPDSDRDLLTDLFREGGGS